MAPVDTSPKYSSSFAYTTTAPAGALAALCPISPSARRAGRRGVWGQGAGCGATGGSGGGRGGGGAEPSGCTPLSNYPHPAQPHPSLPCPRTCHHHGQPLLRQRCPHHLGAPVDRHHIPDKRTEGRGGSGGWRRAREGASLCMQAPAAAAGFRVTASQRQPHNHSRPVRQPLQPASRQAHVGMPASVAWRSSARQPGCIWMPAPTRAMVPRLMPFRMPGQGGWRAGDARVGWRRVPAALVAVLLLGDTAPASPPTPPNGWRAAVHHPARTALHHHPVHFFVEVGQAVQEVALLGGWGQGAAVGRTREGERLKSRLVEGRSRGDAGC